MTTDSNLTSRHFPRAAKYHPEWIVASASGGANSLWLTEWLAAALDLRPGMRVLDLGCGRAASSIFLRREFGVQVWAADLCFSADENVQRIRDAGVDDGVFPIRADARALPFPENYFDAAVCIDSFHYFATDDLFLSLLARVTKPGGQLAIAGSGLVQEIDGPLPDHLREWWTPDVWTFHTAAWWRRHWERTGIVDIETAGAMPDGWQRWRQWLMAVAPENTTEISTLDADAGRYLGYVRLVARRRAGAPLAEPFPTIPAGYTKAPLLRDGEG